MGWIARTSKRSLLNKKPSSHDLRLASSQQRTDTYDNFKRKRFKKKTHVRAKLFANHLTYPTEEYQVYYVITHLIIKQKALQYLRTTKQGKEEFLPHFYKAGLGSLNNALKINYLKNSLNRKLLRY
ncbi:hypothetical protein GGP41_003554 [Bipolaris sorokiniana]|uniref:Uncharacterized protein n=1 Tax=Cochliobolus sativus TaxID=45130 RepID=A0A8H5ZG76_COCSA|nr:hypothetical protein GGP41_003554 [Bipolaris sorokiniana]